MMPRLQGLNLALAIRLAGAGLRTAVEASAQGIYRQAPLFSTAPSETAPLPTITCFRPAAIGIDSVQAAFTMLIRNVEDGSPAAAASVDQKRPSSPFLHHPRSGFSASVR